jgi:hypothetical protein
MVAPARLWNFPAERELETPSMQSEGYGDTQKASLIEAKGNRKKMRFGLHESKDSPIINQELDDDRVEKGEGGGSNRLSN